MTRTVAPAALLLLGAALLLPALGAAPIERAEIYFLDGARAMVETGDWLVPHYRGQPFFDKPALTYWLMAAAMTLLGPTVEAARLVSALAALGTIAATAWLGRQLLDARRGLIGGLALATTAAFVSFGRLAMSDILMTLWSALAMALGVRALARDAPRWALPVLGAVLGLAFQTKGPIAVLLPGLGFLLVAWRVHRERGLRLHPAGMAAALLSFAVLGFGWFAALYSRLGPAPLRHFFLQENVQRFAGALYDTQRPPWFYLGAYLVLGLPWSLFLPMAMGRAWREPRGGSLRLLLAWAGAMLLPLGLSRGKIDYYLLPLLPALSLVVGDLFASSWTRWERAWARGVLLALAAALVAVVFWPPRLPAAWLPGPSALVSVAGAAIAVASLCALLAWRARPMPDLAGVAVAAAAVYLAIAALFLPAFAAAQPHDAVLEDVRRELAYEPRATVTACGDAGRVQRRLLFDARLPVHERCDLWAAAAAAQPQLFLLHGEERQSVGTVLRPISAYRFLPADTLTLRGLFSRPQPEIVKLAANFATGDPVAMRKALSAHQQREAFRRMRRQARERAARP